MRRVLKIIVLLLLIVTVAQTQQREELRDQLQRLQHQIELIKKLAEKYNNVKALALLKQAVENLNESWRFFNHQQMGEARKRFMAAKQNIELAGRLLLFKAAAHTVYDLDKLIHEAELAVHETNNNDARYMLTKARAFQAEANKSYRAGKFIEGQEFQRISIFFADKAIELARGRTKVEPQEQHFEDQSANIKRLFADISAQQSGNSEVKELLKKIKSFLQSSENFQENGDSRQALLYLQMSERLLFRAIDLMQDTARSDEENIAGNLNSLERYLDDIERSMYNESAAESVNLLGKARQFYRAAQRDAANRDYKGASQKILLAQRLATRELRQGTKEDSGDPDKLRNRLSEVERLLQIQKEKFKDSSNPTQIFLLNEIEHLLNSARQAVEQGKSLFAFRQLQLATHLMNRLGSLSKSVTTATKTEQELYEWLNRLQAALVTIKQNNAAAETQPLFKLMENLLGKAGNNLRSGKLTIAEEMLELVQSQVNNLVKEAIN